MTNSGKKLFLREIKLKATKKKKIYINSKKII